MTRDTESIGHTAAVDWAWANIIWLSACILGLLVIAGLLFAFLRGRALYRTAMATQGIVEEHVTVLSAEAERAQAGVDRIAEGQEALTRHIDGLTTRIAVAKVLGTHAAAAIRVLQAPLKYLGR